MNLSEITVEKLELKENEILVLNLGETLVTESTLATLKQKLEEVGIPQGKVLVLAGKGASLTVLKIRE